MTTPPVMSVTDELLGEIESACEAEPIVELGRSTIRTLTAEISRLRAENAELANDAVRYRWLRERIENKGDMVIAKCSEWSIESWSGDDPDATIDAAMFAKC